MCGIIGSVGSMNHYEVIRRGLKRLEYRGYDSSGISYLDEERIHLIKTPSSLDDLDKIVHPYQAFAAMGHTRWATHGKVSLENTHPFLSPNQTFALVHNGTIENYRELKEELEEQGYRFSGESDSEVALNYLEYLYSKEKDVLKSLFLLDRQLKGSYSFVVLFRDEPRLYFLKNETPLLIAKDKEGYLISSDLYAFETNSLEYCELKNHQYGFLEKGKMGLYFEGKRMEEGFRRIEIQNEKTDQIHCFMEKEIEECPEVIESEIAAYAIENLIDEKTIETLKKARKIYVIACGTSYHAGLLFKRWVSHAEVEVKLASEFIYEELTFGKNDAFILISQSGETLDVIKSLERLQGRYTIGITNNPRSKIAREVKQSLDIRVGKEISVASTKAYFGEAVVLYLLAMKLTGRSDNDLKRLPKYLKTAWNQRENVRLLAEEIRKYRSLYFLGKGIDYDAALECSLKLKEITYLHSEALYIGELKHGPLALVGEDFPVIVVSSQPRFKGVIDLAKQEIEARKGKIFEFPMQEDDYALNFLVQVYFGDLLSLYVGRLLNVNIDKPRNLAKSVTVE